MSFREFYDRWGWAITVVAMVMILSVMILGRDAFCTPEDQNCTREWLSALGGWAAVFVTVPTVLFAAKQLKDADSAGRQLARQTIFRRRSLVRRAQQNARVVLERIRHDKKQFKSPSFLPGGGISAREAQLVAKALRELLDEGIFVQFEQEIGVAKIGNISLIRGATDHFIASTEHWNILDSSRMQSELDQLLRNAQAYAAEMEEIASVFLAEDDGLKD